MNMITELEKLSPLLKLNLPGTELNLIKQATAQFGFLVTKDFVRRMRVGDAHDPLLRQVLPTAKELTVTKNYSNDPLDEAGANKLPQLLHKYAGRVLVKVTSSCPLHCRFCFRRHALGAGELTAMAWQRICGYIAADDSIREVILSGGDPLMLPPAKLAIILTDLAKIGHLKFVRIHTRVPIVMPTRVTEALVKLLLSTRFSPVMVVHANHAQEINAEVAAAIDRLRTAKLNVLNQSVLLKGINDSVVTLSDLNFALGKIGVIPYYLHVLDKVAGAAHFAISRTRARRLHRKLQECLPGYLLPRLVCEEAGQGSKTLL